MYFNTEKLMFSCFVILVFVCCFGTCLEIQPPPALVRQQAETGRSTIAPPTFPDKSSTNITFKQNATIEAELLSHSQLPKIAPYDFPENPTKYPIIQPNETLISKFLHSNIPPTEPTPETTAIPPPFKFPTDSVKYKIIMNKTQEEKFLQRSHVDMEVPDLLSTTTTVKSEARKDKIDTEVSDLLSNKNYEGQLDVDQVDPRFMNKTTGKFSEDLKRPMVQHVIHNRGMANMSQGPLAGIMIGVLLVIALFGYVTLVMWRRALEVKYGNRERLVNEEDFDPQYDNRFEL